LVGEGQELTYEEVMERYAYNEEAESPDQPVLTGRQLRRYAFIGNQRQHAVQKHNGIFFMFFIFFQIINIFVIAASYNFVIYDSTLSSGKNVYVISEIIGFDLSMPRTIFWYA